MTEPDIKAMLARARNPDLLLKLGAKLLECPSNSVGPNLGQLLALMEQWNRIKAR